MDVDGVAKLLDASGKFFGAVIWPLALAYLLVRFRSDISSFVSAFGEFSLKGGGFEASAKRKQDVAGAALVAAAVSRTEGGAAPVSAAAAVREAGQVVGSVNSRIIRQVARSVVLWVDDQPTNNDYERQSLEAFGVRFLISTSTEDALDKLSTESIDAVISDMGRPPDNQAGYTLLEKLRSSGSTVPYIIYSNSRSAEHNAEARRRGALGCTNRATELFELVLSALREHDDSGRRWARR